MISDVNPASSAPDAITDSPGNSPTEPRDGRILLPDDKEAAISTATIPTERPNKERDVDLPSASAQHTPITLTKRDRPAPITPSFGIRQTMTIERRVACVPNRAPDSSWSAFVELCHATLQARGFERSSEMRAALERLRPLARYALTMHALEGGSVQFDCGDLNLIVTPIYGQTGLEEELSLPPVAALGELAPDATCDLTFLLTCALNEANLQLLRHEFDATRAPDNALLRVHLLMLNASEKPVLNPQGGEPDANRHNDHEQKETNHVGDI